MIWIILLWIATIAWWVIDDLMLRKDVAFWKAHYDNAQVRTTEYARQASCSAGSYIDLQKKFAVGEQQNKDLTREVEKWRKDFFTIQRRLDRIKSTVNSELSLKLSHTEPDPQPLSLTQNTTGLQ